MKEQKLILTGIHCTNKSLFAKYLINNFGNKFKFGKCISSDDRYKANNKYNYFSEKEIDLAFKNKLFTFIYKTDDNFYQGLFTETFENNNLFCLNIEQVLLMPEYLFNKYDITIVWLDNGKLTRKKIFDDNHETYNFEEREYYDLRFIDTFIKYCNQKQVLYFYSEPELTIISKIIAYWCEKDPKKKRKFLEEDFL
jgi:uridine kinase